MRTLLLLRHGKAVGNDPGGDHERALADRGRVQAQTIATLLDRLGLRPELALVSDARRTRETAELALEGASTRVVTEPQLYAAPAKTVLAILRKQGGDAASVMVVGHNPGIGELARLLEGSGEPQAAIALQDGFPTGSLAVLTFDVAQWADIGPGAGLLTRFIAPDRAPEA